MQLIPTRNILLNLGTSEQKRQEIREYFLKTYTVYEKLFELMKDEESYYLTADPLRHPLVFYFGHTATFFINKLVLAKILDKRINPSFESIFAIGVDEMSWDDLNQSNYKWPRIAEIQAYRDAVKAKILELIDTLPLAMPISWESPFWAIMMGIEHERIHLETSSVLIRQLPLERVKPSDFWKVCPLDTPIVQNELLHVKGTTLRLEKKRDDALYGWDNEYGLHVKEVKDFKASKYLVSNAEFLAFVANKGYETQSFWSEEGWKWRTYKNATMPLFWRIDASGYTLRLMAEEIEMPWSWPVEINYLEAKAFCNWKSQVTGKSIRLPSEEEWYVLHDLHVKVEEPFWDKAPANLNLEYFASSVPVDSLLLVTFTMLSATCGSGLKRRLTDLMALWFIHFMMIFLFRPLMIDIISSKVVRGSVRAMKSYEAHGMRFAVIFTNMQAFAMLSHVSQSKHTLYFMRQILHFPKFVMPILVKKSLTIMKKWRSFVLIWVVQKQKHWKLAVVLAGEHLRLHAILKWYTALNLPRVL